MKINLFRLRNLLLGIVVIAALACPGLAAAEEKGTEVAVRVPAFDISLNGRFINNINNQHPLIVYKDITYIPLDSPEAKYLGLQTVRDGISVLGINIINPSTDYIPDDFYINDMELELQAKIADHSVVINSRLDLTPDSPYPLLFFRDRVYFPLTWALAAGEFGWQYSWNLDQGLIIESAPGKAAEIDNVLTIMNTTAMSRGYRFQTELALHDRQEQRTAAGAVQNELVYNIRPELKLNYVHLKSRVTPDEQYYFENGVYVRTWAWGYSQASPAFPGCGLQGHSPDIKAPSWWDIYPMAKLNDFIIIGEKGKAGIVTPDGEENEPCNRFIITFAPQSRWNNETIEVLIDWDKKVVKEMQTNVIMTDSVFGSYTLHTVFEEVQKW